MYRWFFNVGKGGYPIKKSLSMSMQFWMVYESFSLRISFDEYSGKLIEKKHVCAVGKCLSGFVLDFGGAPCILKGIDNA